jgi:deoxyribodipyrimidine photo-lyase
VHLCWHRDDLRASDNVALAAAAEAAAAEAAAAEAAAAEAIDGTDPGEERPGEDAGVDRGGAVPVFCLDEDVLAYASPNRVAFMLDALASLREDYRSRGSDLVVRRGDPRRVLVDLADAFDADGVHWNRGHSGLARERDGEVRDALADAFDSAVDQADHADALCHEPGSITTNEGTHYLVFSYFWRKWRDREKPAPEPAPAGDALWAPHAWDVDPGTIPDAAALGFAEPTAERLPDASTATARERLESFLADDVYEYADRRDEPAADATSRLSPHLRWGTIGIREVHDAVLEARERASSDDGDASQDTDATDDGNTTHDPDATDDGNATDDADANDDADASDDVENVEAFRRQLAWREFYAHVLHFTPAVVSANVTDFEREIPWRNDPDELAAWKRGETGYPLVDAGMRQLRAEGFLHNRVRMVVASFLTKDLLVDWREGYAHFREHLVDHDPANDAGGWQWAASTGTDAQPYFRVFNPMTQCETHDPDGAYVRAHVPELADAPTDVIHEWHELAPADRDAHAPDYPAPIVDHAERREAAIAAFETARGE